MDSASNAALFPSDDDSVMYMAGGDEPLTNFEDILNGTASMMPDFDGSDAFHASPRQHSVGFGFLKSESEPAEDSRQQPGSSPESSAEDSSSDDSARHKRNSSSMSIEANNFHDGTSHWKEWSSGGALVPASSEQTGLWNTTQSFDHEASNEAMARNFFDFDSAASSPGSTPANKTLSTEAPRPLFSSHIDTQPAFSPPPVNSPSVTTHMSRTSFEPMPSSRPAAPGNSFMTTAASLSAQKSATSRRAVVPAPAKSHISPNTSLSALASPRKPPSTLHIHRNQEKSRVETQITVKVTLWPFPEGVKKLHLPTHTISKPKLIQRPAHEKSPDTLELYSMLVCTSAMNDPQKRAKALAAAAAVTRESEKEEGARTPGASPDDCDAPVSPHDGGPVTICAGCVIRERKRAGRKKAKKPEEDAAWAKDETRRVIVFNTNEIRPWTDPEPSNDYCDAEGTSHNEPSQYPLGAKQVKLPVRLACYCRHHSEKAGFQVIVTIKDHQDNLVAQNMSDSIVITDDHKTHLTTHTSLTNALPANNLPASAVPLDGLPSWMAADTTDPRSPVGQFDTPLQRNAFSSNDLQFLQQQQQMMSRPLQHSYLQLGHRPFASVQSPSHNTPVAARTNKSRPASPTGGGPLKKRKSSNGPKIPESLVMTKSDRPSPSNIYSALPNSATSAPYTATTSAASPLAARFSPHAMQHFAQNTNQRQPASLPSDPPTPDSAATDQFLSLRRSESFEANAAAQPMFSQPASRLASRAPSPTSLSHTGGMQATSRSSHAPVPSSQVAASQRLPVIHRVVPGRGPISGGTEVICLGSGFKQGMEVMFGDALATQTTYVGETSLSCIVPPASQPGQVTVSLKDQYEQFLIGRSVGNMDASFTYINTTTEDLLRQALMILGHKFTGKFEDPGDIVRKTLSSDTNGMTRMSYESAGMQNHFQMSSHELALDEEASVEDAVLDCVLRVDSHRSPFPPQYDLECYNGQTLLHLAASLGYRRLVAALLKCGANPNARDRNGYSPLHMASLRGHPQVIRRLQLAGGNPLLRSIRGFTPADLATDTWVLQALCQPAVFALGARIGRPSDIDAFVHKSPPASRATSTGRYDAGDEWDDVSSDENDEIDDLSDSMGALWSASRRNSFSIAKSSQKGDDKDPSPVAVMTAWRQQLVDQVQHFQQMFEKVMPHVQMPTLPAIPPIQNLPNYQTPAMVRRLSSFVPVRSSPAPTEEDDQKSKDRQEAENKWWDIFSNSGSGPVPAQSSPPAYNELYPEDTADGLDKKASAVASALARNAKDTAATNTTRAQSICATTKAVAASKSELVNVGAPQMKGLTSDRKLFFVWIPLLMMTLLIAFGDRGLLTDTFDAVKARWQPQVEAPQGAYVS